MRSLYGQCHGAMILLHGGAGPQDPSGEGLLRATASLQAIAASGLKELKNGTEALDVVVHCLVGLELDEQFNAGRGAALQADGQARLTAALMDGHRGTFSGVISARYLNHPSHMARALQERSARVLTDPGTELLARELGLPVESSLTPRRVQRWAEKAQTGEGLCDTVGCLLRTADGRLYAGTSTGGRGYEFPGRVSDSGTVAGTYCTDIAGICVTGTGEEIVDDALAARLETRRRDGMSLRDASERCFAEAKARQRAYGWIAHDRDGHWAAVHATPAMSFVVMDESGLVASTASS
jgi:L-asparaginase